MARKNWSDLTTSQKRAIYVAGAVEGIVTTAALRDLTTRGVSDVRGPKAGWVLLFFVQPVGPLAYFAFGRL